MHAFSPKNPIFCTFLQGGGTTFWQAQKRGFWGSGRRAGAARADTFCVTFLVSQKLLQASFPDQRLKEYKLSDEVFFERISDERVSITMRTTFGACRKDGVLFLSIYIFFTYTILQVPMVPRSVDVRSVHHVCPLIR